MIKYAVLIISVAMLIMALGCSGDSTEPSTTTLSHDARWGIYKLNLDTQVTSLIYSRDDEMYASALRLNSDGDRLIFAQRSGGQTDNATEIYSIDVNGKNLTQLTNNSFFDLYPAWSPDGTQVAFLSWRERDLDIYIMDADGANTFKFYDSGFHDADIDWGGENIVFTSQFAIWRIPQSGGEAKQITEPPARGEWGKANLPVGDYDPRLSPDGKKLVFERLENTDDVNGGYNIFTINNDGTNEKRLTNNYWSQGLASWSHDGSLLVYSVAAINGEGKYDIYMMNSDGTNMRNVTPDYFPETFLCHAPIFSGDDKSIFFIGQWWE